ncbi:DUF3558 domain-containing protein [Nocardia sp. CA2R105]|uniref:DUF3558 family protein n=1 Tax=Nocardia coffeae TaxID=2873381 RepID=UPI001CA717F9|nr:DUF3558 family protein [Nocardia coffeae]MBY8855424.1 DUF3558 domain-containing protein [Nocardia coffeae]
MSLSRTRKLVFSLPLISILLAGCNSEKTAATPEISPTIPSSFDPCHDIPASALESEKLLANPNPQVDSSGDDSKVKKKGCKYSTLPSEILDRGAGILVEVTNQTTAYYEYYHHESTIKKEAIDGRAALVDGPIAGEACTLILEIRGGAIRFDTASSSHDPCQILLDFASKTAPALPPGI